MGMVVRTNYSALNATRHLNKNSASLSSSLEKLASGFKINKSADDASGLAISEKMKAQIKALDAASANCEDGVSMIQTTEGYLTEVHDMLNRMVELAEKSANGTYETVEGGADAGEIGAAGTDRNALQAEMDQLCAEVDRIAATANFNNVKLFNGDLSTENYDAISSLEGQKAEFASNSSLLAANSAFSSTDGVADVTVSEDFGLSGELSVAYDEDADELTVSLKCDDGSVKSQVIKDDGTVAAGTFVLTGDLEGITLTKDAALTAANATGKLGDISQKEVLRELDAAASGLTLGANMSIAGLGEDVEGSAITVEATALTAGGLVISVEDKVYTNTETITVPGAGEADNVYKLTDANSGDTIEVSIANGFVVGDVTDGIGTVVLGEEIDAGKAKTTQRQAGDGLTLQIGETSNAADKLTVGVDRLHTDTLFADITDYANDDEATDVKIAINSANTVKGVTGYTIDISGQQRASAAAEALRGTINKVSTQRAALGAMQNRLDYTVNNLNTASENITSANSRIRDTDMAKEMTKYTQMNVLSQAAQAMLAQANQQPQSVLQLLG